ncbi:MAG: DUF1028 domain-containing protein [Candidatus Bipolaricaulota bacterium]
MNLNKPVRCSTFSVIAYDPDENRIGVAVQSKFFAVGASVPWVKPGVGAVATQAYTNLKYGIQGLELLEEGVGPTEVLTDLLSDDPQAEMRQVAIMDSNGNPGVHTGRETPAVADHIKKRNFICQGNLLTSSSVVNEMAEEYESNRGRLGRRLIRALRAGQRAGGDKRGRQSAALVVLNNNPGKSANLQDRVDIRVDDHLKPIEELDRLLGLHKLYFDSPETRNYQKVQRGDVVIFQDVLTELGFYDGEVNGKLTDRTVEGLDNFLWSENLGATVTKAEDGEVSVDRRLFDYMKELVNRRKQ